MDFSEFESSADDYIQAVLEVKRLIDLQTSAKQPSRYVKQIIASQNKARTSFGKISHIVSRFSDRRLNLGDGDVIDPFMYSLTIQGQSGSTVMRVGAVLMQSVLDTIRQAVVTHPNVPLENLPKRKTPVPIQYGDDNDKSSPTSDPHMRTRIFLVHGHSERAVSETARFLEKVGLDVVILREQPSSGRTIIEKIIEYSDVEFAVVLLTGDDRGGSKNTTFKNQSFRARQNVILELGFFIGKLGRERVCALYEEGVEIPSDYRGVLFVALDSLGAWRLELSREIKAAGLPININEVL